ncbi:glycyl-tRNA synthetase subunit beta [Enterobacter asburiae]|uniref:Glycyl-tRNA synthetase subunit beta n=1 Tax=Enterobacter asburiae TaxID=61645 RepID=A0A376FI60_ENTAS|nr:glycyl-tRNA synthetase subunit beta [Enterobacter asburiae]
MLRWACWRIIVEKNLNLDLQTLTEEAVRLYGDKLTNAKVVDDVIDFMLGRFRAVVSGRRLHR